jgi:hypothetical protein
VGWNAVLLEVQQCVRKNTRSDEQLLAWRLLTDSQPAILLLLLE